MKTNINYNGDSLTVLKTLPSSSVDCCVSSPPYWKKRNYNIKGQIGQEDVFGLYILNLISVYKEVLRVLKPEGTCFVNLGDTYNGNKKVNDDKKTTKANTNSINKHRAKGIADKCLLMIPQRFAIQMINQGWVLRNNIIWCLAEDTKMFVRRNNEYIYIPIKKIAIGDLVSTLDNKNNFRWVAIKNKFNTGKKQVLKIITKSGKEIISFYEHQFPVKHNYFYGKYLKLHFKKAKDLTTKDYLWVNYKLPTILPKGDSNDYERGFIIGFFIAEGSYIKQKVGVYKDNKFSKNAQKRWGRLKEPKIVYRGIQLSCGIKDLERGYLEHLKLFKVTTKSYKGNSLSIYSRDKTFLNLIQKFVSGEYCDKKHFNSNVWNKSLQFIKAIIDGFLAGDGCFDKDNHRWRVGIKPNQRLKEDLELACRLVGYEFRYEGIRDTNYGTKAMVFAIRKEIKRKTFKFMYADRIDSIEKVGEKQVYDVEVEPIYTSFCGKGKTDVATKERRKSKWNNLFFIANGIWTHNCKPNALPSSVKDRFTVDFENVFFFVKQAKGYYFNQQTEPAVGYEGVRNVRTVWDINTECFSGSHCAVYPKALVKRMVESGCPQDGIVLDPFMGAGTTALVCKQLHRKWIGIDLNKEYVTMAEKRIVE